MNAVCQMDDFNCFLEQRSADGGIHAGNTIMA
jgi:hypothetical protein